MKYLHKKSISQKYLDLLLQFGKLKSPEIKNALSDYLVRGINKTAAAALNNVPAPNLTRAINSLEKNAAIVEKIKEYNEAQKKAQLS